MLLFEIKNEDYETQRVAADDMREALSKYYDYLRLHVNADYSFYEVFTKIKSCVCLGEYVEDDVIK